MIARSLVIAWALAAALLAACTIMNDRHLPSPPRDAGGRDADLAGKCDPSAPFIHIDPIRELNDPSDQNLPRLSRDELTIYYFGENEADGGAHIHQARRPAIDQPFGAPTILFGDIPGATDPSLSANQLRLYFSIGDVGPNPKFGLALAERPTADAAFTTSRVLVPTGGSAAVAMAALLEPPGAAPRLLVSLGGANDSDLASAPVDSAGGVGAFQSISELNSKDDEYDPTPSADGLTLYFSSDRDQSIGQTRIFVSHRSSVTATWDPPTWVHEIAQPADGYLGVGFLSTDYCRLYFYAGRDNGDLFVATRTP